jgi:hypothetical protein
VLPGVTSIEITFQRGHFDDSKPFGPGGAIEEVLTRQPQRIANRLEYCPLMVGLKDAVPLEKRWRLHDDAPLATFEKWF